MVCLSLHQRDPKRKIKIITISTNKDKTATAGYSIKNAMVRCRLFFCAVPNNLVKMSMVAVTLKEQTPVPVYVCRDTPLRGTGVYTGPGSSAPQAQ